MAITNIVVTSLGGGIYQIDFDSTITDYQTSVVRYGPTTSYGVVVNTRGSGGHYTATIGTASPFHFQCEVADYVGGDEKSADQTYPPPVQKPASFLTLILLATGTKTARLLWDTTIIPSGVFQVYRGTTSNLAAAIAIGSPAAPGVGVYNDYGPLTPGTLYYYWLVQVS